MIERDERGKFVKGFTYRMSNEHREKISRALKGRKIKRRTDWTEREIKLLKEKYPEDGANIPEIGRSLNAIHRRAWLLGISVSINPAKRPEVREKISRIKKGNKDSLGCKRSKEFKRRLSDKYRGVGNPFFGKRHSLETKLRMSTASKRLWRNPDFQRKCMTVKRPNKAELELKALLEQNNFPFRYVGDGKVFIEGKCPDFMDCDGSKEIIEFFGEHWHEPEEEEERKKTFARYGFRTLVIWDYELKNQSKVLEKIESFRKGHG